MPTPTYTPIATITLASTDSEIVFSSIPATYRDLILIVNCSASANSFIGVNFNSETTNQSGVYAFGYTSAGSPATGSGTTTSLFLGNAYTSSESMVTASIMDYSATDKHKTILSRWGLSASGAAGFQAGMNALRWANTSAVTTMAVYLNTGTFSIGSTFSLYGISA